MSPQEIIEIASHRTPNEKTWEMLETLTSDQEITQMLIEHIREYPPFSEEQEAAVIEFVVICLAVGLAGDIERESVKFDPQEYNWNDIIYGLYKSHNYLFEPNYLTLNQ